MPEEYSMILDSFSIINIEMTSPFCRRGKNSDHKYLGIKKKKQIKCISEYQVLYGKSKLKI